MSEKAKLTEAGRKMIQVVCLCLAPSIVSGIIFDRLRWFRGEPIVILLALCVFAILFGILTLIWEMR